MHRIKSTVVRHRLPIPVANGIFGILLLLFQSLIVDAQVQKGFNFQGYARNSEGAAITNQSVNVKFTIYPRSLPASPDFEETQATTTDEFGVFQLVVGAVNNPQFKNLRFGEKDYWLKVEVKTAGSDFVVINETELLAVPYARTADNGVPVGTIFPFAGPKSKIPVGYLACDGASYNAADYPSLFNVLGSGWGGNASSFNVPDLRGRFLRGVSDGTTRDEDKEGRVEINAGGNTGDQVGSLQGDMFPSHGHSGTTTTDGNHTHGWMYGYEKSDGFDNGGTSFNEFTHISPGDPINPHPIGNAGSHSHTFNTNGTGGSESRPENANVYYIIKF